MKKAENIRDLLGFTQEELALVLKVSRSQLSLFELGKRDLPLAAKQLLSALLENARTTKSVQLTPHQDLKHQDKIEKYLQSLLQENEFQRLVLETKIMVAAKKYAMQVNVLQSVAYLTKQAPDKRLLDGAFLQSISAKAEKGMEEQGLIALQELELRMELLENEKLLLESKILKMQKVRSLK